MAFISTRRSGRRYISTRRSGRRYLLPLLLVLMIGAGARAFSVGAFCLRGVCLRALHDPPSLCKGRRRMPARSRPHMQLGSTGTSIREIDAAQREFDVIIFGATGFTGRLACEYMHSNYKHVAWAVAARNASKAKQHLADIGADNVKVLTADALDPASVQGVVQRTRTIANFAGTPFLDKALPVVMACARYGTHYVDITGEVSLHRASYERYHRSAVASKALIMHGLSCPLCRSSVAR